MGMLTYEAAPAFDPAFKTLAPLNDLPLAAFAIFDTPSAQEEKEQEKFSPCPIGTMIFPGPNFWKRSKVSVLPSRRALIIRPISARAFKPALTGMHTPFLNHFAMRNQSLTVFILVSRIGKLPRSRQNYSLRGHQRRENSSPAR